MALEVNQEEPGMDGDRGGEKEPGINAGLDRAADAPSTATTCPYCGVGCGLVVRQGFDRGGDQGSPFPQPSPSSGEGAKRLGDDRGGDPGTAKITVRGDPTHPANRGRICTKGAALPDTIAWAGRLLQPEVDGHPVAWSTAIATVAERLAAVRAAHGPEAIAFYVSGQLLTEDYYVANKLLKGFIGSPHIDSNSRLCMAAAAAGHSRAFGEDLVPGCYADLEEAELVVLVGSNLAWCHPVLYQRLEAAKAANSPPLAARQIVVIDPRRTATCALADLHLAPRPGTDGILFAGLLHHLRREGVLDFAYLEGRVSGFGATLAAAATIAPSLPAVAAATGVAEEQLLTFYRWFTRTERVVSLWSQGVNQSTRGTETVNAIVNCHLATGRIGRPGMGPFSVTGQPNAMGGREVGAMAHLLAGHLRYDQPDEWAALRAFWRAPALVKGPGLKAVDLFAAVGRGEIRALWIMATNPVVSLPDSDAVRAALARCPLVIVSDCEDATDLRPYAHIRLPALAWGEKDGTVTNSERCISRSRAFLPAPLHARPDWWIVTQVAQALGHGDAFPYRHPVEPFREHCAVTTLVNDGPNLGRRVLDLGALAGMDEAEYEALAPRQWPLPAASGAAGAVGTARLDFATGFPAAGGRARMWPTAAVAAAVADAAPASASPSAPPTVSLPSPLRGEGGSARDFLSATTPVASPSPSGAPPSFPLLLNSGRIRDQWHTMTRSGRSPKLAAMEPMPVLRIHPADLTTDLAAELGADPPADLARAGIAAHALVRLESPTGGIVRVRAVPDPDVPPGQPFLAMHWSDIWTAAGRINALTAAVVDPISGQPGLKANPVRLVAEPVAWHGLLLCREAVPVTDCLYWCRAVVAGGLRYDLAGGSPAPEDWQAWLRARIPIHAEDELISFLDPGAGRCRLAVLRGGALWALLYASREPLPLVSPWLTGLLGAGVLGPAARSGVLAGRPPAAADPGALVCTCLGVGEKAIRAEIARLGLSGLAGGAAGAVIGDGSAGIAALGAALGVGTQCGGCRPALARLLAEVAPAPASPWASS